ncbi:MAG: DUF4162 domain-containing protein [Nanoarchaeota archaeon]|nr:DUF4162 domain-containing protein [Nanoarchaeota archaeon]
MNIKIKGKEDKRKIIEFAKKLPIKKIVDQGHQLIIYPNDTEKTMLSLLKEVRKQNLFLYDVDLRKPSLNEIFAKVAKEKKEDQEE